MAKIINENLKEKDDELENEDENHVGCEGCEEGCDCCEGDCEICFPSDEEAEGDNSYLGALSEFYEEEDLEDLDEDELAEGVELGLPIDTYTMASTRGIVDTILNDDRGLFNEIRGSGFVKPQVRKKR